MKTVLLISTAKLSHSLSESTRMWYVSKGLNKHGISTKIIGRKSEFGDNIVGDNVIAIKPILKGFAGELLFRLYISIFALQILFSKGIKEVILRGYDLIFLAFFLKIIGKKIIYDFHGYRYKEQETEESITRSKITKILDILMLIIADHVISVSEGLVKDLPEKYKQKTIVLSNGVDLDLFKNDMNSGLKREIFEKYKLSIDKKTIGFVGMWEPWMNIKDILNVSRHLKNIQILIVGKGYKFEELYKSTSDNSSIVWTGQVDHGESIKLIRCIDICITPYSQDNYYANISGVFASRKNKEYIAAGKPIIMSDIKGREQFLGSENVLLYEPGNSKDLANKIAFLLRDELLYKKLHENNKKLSKEFGWELLLEKSGLIFILMGFN